MWLYNYLLNCFSLERKACHRIIEVGPTGTTWRRDDDTLSKLVLLSEQFLGALN